MAKRKSSKKARIHLKITKKKSGSKATSRVAAPTPHFNRLVAKLSNTLYQGEWPTVDKDTGLGRVWTLQEHYDWLVDLLKTPEDGLKDADYPAPSKDKEADSIAKILKSVKAHQDPKTNFPAIWNEVMKAINPCPRDEQGADSPSKALADPIHY